MPICQDVFNVDIPYTGGEEDMDSSGLFYCLTPSGGWEVAYRSKVYFLLKNRTGSEATGTIAVVEDPGEPTGPGVPDANYIIPANSYALVEVNLAFALYDLNYFTVNVTGDITLIDFDLTPIDVPVVDFWITENGMTEKESI